MMKASAKLINPHLKKGQAGAGEDKRGKLLLATIQDDIHDIGKNIYGMMMDLSGFDVKDIGVDVRADIIVTKAREFQADITGISGLC
jgi:cobalamin-dependent methionine synthase I